MGQPVTRRTTHDATLKVCPETGEISIKVLEHERDVLRRHRDVWHKVEGDGDGTVRELFGEGRVGEREGGEVAADVMRRGVEPNLVFEASVVDLEIIIRVTPTTEPRRRCWNVRRPGHLCKVFDSRNSIEEIQITIPSVRSSPSVIAFLDGRMIEELDILSVPREELTGIVDLYSVSAA